MILSTSKTLATTTSTAPARRLWLLAGLFALLAAAFVFAGCANSQSASEGGQDGAQSVESAAAVPESELDKKIAGMSLEDRAAQLLIVEPEDLSPESAPITSVDDKVREDMAERPVPGGLCYFADNMRDPDQLRQLLADFQEAAEERSGVVLFQSVDEEGGELVRVADVSAMGVKNVDNASIIGAKGDAETAYDAAAHISEYLLDFGFNVDFAPVCDIANGVGNTIGRRAFDSSAEGVVPMVEAQVRAFNDAGILCSAKHFPGIGFAKGDSHDGLIETNRTLDEMRESEFLPFKAVIEQGVPMVMVGHIACPELTGDDTPASFSSVVMSDILRDELGFDGLVVTDSLGMGAATDAFPEEELAVRAIQAGADIALLPANYLGSVESIVKAVKDGSLSEEDLNKHVKRVLKAKYALMGEETGEAAGEGDGEATGDGGEASDGASTSDSNKLELDVDEDLQPITEAEWGGYFYYGDGKMATWARNFPDNPAVRVRFQYSDENGQHTLDSRDPAVVAAAFNAIASLNVQEWVEPGNSDDYTAWIFVMDDGSQKRFNFTDGKAEIGTRELYAVDGNELFDSIEEAIRK